MQELSYFFLFWILNLIFKRLLWFQCQLISSDSTNDHSHYLAFLPAPPQYSKHISKHIFSFGFTLGSKSLHLSWNRIITLWPMLVRMKTRWTRDLCNLSVKLFFTAHFSSIRTEGCSKNQERASLWPESHLCTLFVFRRVSQEWLGEDLTQADFQSSEIC